MLRGHDAEVRRVAISPDSLRLITAGNDGTARLWDLASTDPETSDIILRGHKALVWSVAFSPDNHWLATGSDDRTARLWDLSKPNPAAKSLILKGHDRPARVLLFSPDNHWLATGPTPLAVSDNFKTLLWDLTRLGPEPVPFSLPRDVLTAPFAISPDSHWLLTLNIGRPMSLWNLRDKDPVHPPIDLRDDIECLDYLIGKDGRWLAARYRESVRLWDLKAADPRTASVTIPSPRGRMLDVAMSPDGRRLTMLGEDRKLVILDLESPQLTPAGPPLPTGLAGANRLVVSLDSHLLAILDGEGRVRLWDIIGRTPMTPLVSLPPRWRTGLYVHFSPGGRWLMMRPFHTTDETSREVLLWDLCVKVPLGSAVVLRGHEAAIVSHAFDRNGHRLATSDERGVVLLWDLTDPNPSTTAVAMPGQTSEIRDLKFSSDGRWLASGGDDHLARLSRLRLPELIKLAEHVAGRNMTLAEWQQYFPNQGYRPVFPGIADSQ